MSKGKASPKKAGGDKAAATAKRRKARKKALLEGLSIEGVRDECKAAGITYEGERKSRLVTLLLEHYMALDPGPDSEEDAEGELLS